jgi:hypothetical protein
MHGFWNANVIAATETIVESFNSPKAGVNPQYLMSVRNILFQQLAAISNLSAYVPARANQQSRSLSS